MAKSSDYGGIFFNPSTGEHYSRIYDQPEISPDAIEAYRRFISQESDSEPVGELTYNDVSGENLIDVPYEEPRITERSVDLSGMIPEKRTAQEPKKNDAVRDFLKGTWEKASSPEMMAFGWLPMLGMAEVLASKGKSKGDAAMAMQKNVLSGIQQKKKDEISAAEREQTAKDSALKRQLTEAQIAEASKKAASAQSQQERTDRYNAAVAEAYSREDIDDAEKDRLAMGLYKVYFPAEYNKMAAQAALRPVIDPYSEEALAGREAIARINAKYHPGPRVSPLEAGRVADAEAARQQAIQDKQTILELTDSITNDPAFSTGLDIGRLSQMVQGTRGYTFKAKVDNLKSKLTLDARAKLKGQGQISDKESTMLENAVTMLDMGLSKEAFLAELRRIQSALGARHFGSRDEAEAAYERGEIKPGTRLYINGRLEGVAE